MSYLRKSSPALSILLLSLTSAFGAEPPPNILVVMVDDMGYPDIGCSCGDVRTATLDSLAANGVRLARFTIPPAEIIKRHKFIEANLARQAPEEPAALLKAAREQQEQ